MELKEVFEPVLNFIRNFQKKDKEIASKQAAKDRLKLVLMQDRASVSPDFFEMMKKEIIDVIKKYIEIDEESLEVELTRGMEAGLEGPALYATIPIKNVKPVAPQNGEGKESSETSITEAKADAVAEQLLNEAEEIVNRVKLGSAEKKEQDASKAALKNEEEENPISEIAKEVEKEDLPKEISKTETVKEELPKSEAKKTATTKVDKSTAKTKPTSSTKKSTTKSKKETKK